MKRTAVRQTFGGRGLSLLVVLLIGLVLGDSLNANAQALLGGRNSATQALRLKSLDVNVAIHGAFARTQVQMVFQNELAERTEADFEYVVPDGCLVTHFAYWFKDEKVVARVVEKERALSIYQAITTRQRDPALIERINKNKFRARIFPIEPNADLKVEMRWVQVLTSDARGIVYKFPLKPQEEGKGTLENLNIRVKATPDAGVTKIVNNYKLTPKTEEKARLFQLAEKNYRPTQDFIVRFERPTRALHASLYAAPAGGRDGFFALALTPSQNLKAPKLTFNGVATYDVLPARLPDLRAHQTFVVVGRYRPGNKPASIALSGFGPNTARQSVSFSRQREDNNLASKLWAATQIEALSPNGKIDGKNRERLIALSTRFTLPSSVTSWLAVPKAEWENFKQEIARSNMERIGLQLVELKKQGKSRTRLAKQLRSQFYKACFTLGKNPAKQLANYLDEEKEQRRILMENALRVERQAIAKLMAQALANGQNAKATRYQRRINKVNHQLDETSQEEIEAAYNEQMAQTAARWAEIKLRPNVDEKRLLQLENQLKRLQPKATSSAQQLQRTYIRMKFNSLIARNAKGVLQEIIAGQKESEKARELERRSVELGTRISLEGSAILRASTRYQARFRADELVNQIVEEQYEYKPSQEKIEELQAQLKQLKSIDIESAELMRSALANWSINGWAFGKKWARAQYGEKANPDEAAYWRKQLEKAVNRYNKQVTTPEIDYFQSAESMLANAEFYYFQDRIRQLRNQRATEITLKNQDSQALQRIDDELEKIKTSISPKARALLATGNGWASIEGMRALLIAEYKNPQSNPARLKEIEQKFISMQTQQYFTRNLIDSPKLYGQLRTERLKARTGQELLAEKLKQEDATLLPAEKERLSTNQAQLARREKELAVRMGDPLIQVQAPQNALQVVAVFPGGEIKQMAFNPDSQQWEARFDVPTYAAEGAYTVSVIVVFKDGTRKHLTMRFHVDVTAPGGAGKALLIDKGRAKVLRLELDADEDTARVQALLPGGRKVELAPSTQQANRFFALAQLTPNVQQALEVNNLTVAFILTDRAHNRTTIMVNMNR